MGKNLTRKILESHLAKPSAMNPGDEIYVKMDQTLTHDINAVMTYLAFEAIGLDRTQVETSVSYLDHNLLYLDNKTPDDHIYLQSVAKRFGVHVSRPGNGICHAVHVARFGVPGKLSMGGDSHTPHGGSIGMLCIGVGGMDVATAMTGVPMRLKMPQIIKVNLKGHLKPGCNAKEIILEMLRRVGIKGGLGKVFEYVGEGAAGLRFRACQHHQHGRGDGSNHFHFPGRRAGPPLHESPGPGRPIWRCFRTRMPSMTVRWRST